MGATALRYLSIISYVFCLFVVMGHSLLIMSGMGYSAMAGIPISGALVQKYGFLALSVYAGVSLLVGGLLLIVARGKQRLEFWTVV